MKKYWLKSIGTSKHWIEKHLFAGFEEEIHFPYELKSVQEGDWLLLYAIGHKRVIGLFEVTSTVKEFKGKELEVVGKEWRNDFPFYVMGKNLFKLFSNNWYSHNLNPNELDDKFVIATEKPVTEFGNNSIDAIQHGHSHLELKEDFLKFMIEEMKNVI